MHGAACFVGEQRHAICIEDVVQSVEPRGTKPLLPTSDKEAA